MNLKTLLKGNIEDFPYNKSEALELFQIIERDLKESQIIASCDWKLMIAYNAGLNLCKLLVRYHNYRIKGSNHHKNTIIAAKELISDTNFKDFCDFLDQIRRKRNNMTYNQVGLATESEALNLIEEIQRTKMFVENMIEL